MVKVSEKVLQNELRPACCPRAERFETPVSDVLSSRLVATKEIKENSYYRDVRKPSHHFMILLWP